MDSWAKKFLNGKNKMVPPIIFRANRDSDLNEENEVQQSLLSKHETVSCLAKNDRTKGDSAKKVQWKDGNGNSLVQVKEFPPDDSDDSSDDDEYDDDVCICTIM